MLLQWDFDNTKADTSLLIKKKKKTFMIMVLIYVDDMLITGPNNVDLKKLFKILIKLLHWRILANYLIFWAIEVLYDANCVYLSQKKYIRDLLSKVDILDCKDIDTPISTRVKLQKETQRALGQHITDLTHYRSIIGGMQYLILTRPEITFSMHKLSQ